MITCRLIRSVSSLLTVAAVTVASAASPTSAQDAGLIEAAKREGAVTWYTTQIVDPLVREVIAAFGKKFGIKADFYRGGSTDVAIKIQQESNAGRMFADIFDGPTPPEALKKFNLVERWLPESTKEFNPAFVDPEGYWAATNDTLQSTAVNTELVRPTEFPKSWNDLLAPRFKGKIIWSSTPSFSGATGFIGLVIKERGAASAMDFFKQLAQQRPAGNSGSARAVMDQVVSGEYAVGLQMFPNHAAASIKLGAPIRWLPAEPAISGVVSAIAMTKGAPHPNAAKLLLTFILGEEGQTIFRNNFYIPANPHVQPIDPDLDPNKYRTIHISPAELISQEPSWTAIFNDVFK